MRIADSLVDTPRGRLAVRCWRPDGARRAPILMIHDSLGCIALWRGLPKALAEATGRAVIAYDRPGFGASEAAGGAPNADFIAAEMAWHLPPLGAALGFDRVVLFGHSVGGAMAVHGAGDFQDRCDALVTVATQAFVEDLTLAGIRAAERAFADPAAFDRLRRHHGDRTRAVLDGWIGAWTAPGFAGWSLVDALPRVRCPALVIHGDRDEYGSLAHPNRIAGGIAGPVRLQIMPGAGHFPHRAREAEVVAMVADFLAAP